MKQLQCNTCGGIYAPRQADGLAYYHACPPLEKARILNGPRAGRTVELADVVPGEFTAAVFVPRPGGRDENVRVVVEADGTTRATIRAEGGGVTVLPDEDRP